MPKSTTSRSGLAPSSQAHPQSPAFHMEASSEDKRHRPPWTRLFRLPPMAFKRYLSITDCNTLERMAMGSSRRQLFKLAGAAAFAAASNAGSAIARTAAAMPVDYGNASSADAE